jgi:hypothetical protein
MLSLKMNDSAMEALEVLAGQGFPAPPDGGLAPALQRRLAAGITWRSKVLTWADSTGNADSAPAGFPDLTGWECADSSFHLEDFVPGEFGVFGESDQRTLLRQGTALALGLAALVRALDPPPAVRCLISANDTGATFRFHQIRPAESWNDPDLDRYRLEKLMVVDIEPR